MGSTFKSKLFHWYSNVLHFYLEMLPSSLWYKVQCMHFCLLQSIPHGHLDFLGEIVCYKNHTIPHDVVVPAPAFLFMHKMILCLPSVVYIYSWRQRDCCIKYVYCQTCLYIFSSVVLTKYANTTMVHYY